MNRVLLVTLLAVAAAPGPAPRFDAWTVIGPGGGGTMRRPVVSPYDPDLVVQGCDMTGAYITHDGGDSWRMFNLGWVPNAFAFDPVDPNVIYAGTGVLWRSEDAGRTWGLVFPDPARHTVEHGWGDHAEAVYTTDDATYPSGQMANIHAIAVDPGSPERLALAMSATDPGPPGSHPAATLVLTSEDRGKTWTRRGKLLSGRVFALWRAGEDDAVQVEAIGQAGVEVVSDGKTGVLRGGPKGLTSASVARGPGGDMIVYATTPISRKGDDVTGGIWVSEDSGQTWRPSNGNLAAAARGEGDREWGPAAGSRPTLGPIAVSAKDPKVAYVGLRGLRLEKDADAQSNGIARTADGGKTWTVVLAESDRPQAGFATSWIEERAVEQGYNFSVWLDAPYDIAVAPTDPDVVYASDLFRSYRTRDGGKTWSQTNSVKKGEDSWTSRGLDVTTAYGVHFDPFDRKRMFITYTDIGLFRSEDGGASWIGSTRGIPTPWRNTTYWVVFDPDVKDLMWGAFAGNHDLPRPKMWRHADPSTYVGGVAVSTDGGRTWTPSRDGMEESAITHVLLDPDTPRGERTLYACAFGRGVYKTTNGGARWVLHNNGIEGQKPFAWRLARDRKGTLYLVVARRSEGGRIGDEGDGALYRSTDRAAHWDKVFLPEGTNGPSGLAIDPDDPRRLYLAAWGVLKAGDDTGGGIFLSTDAGNTWRPVLTEAQHVYDVTIDPREPSKLYACGFDRGVYRSTDRGETWHRIRGFNFKWGQRVIVDPYDPDSIYVTAFGGGVWHGPAAGDPDAVEDRLPFGEPATRAAAPTTSPEEP
jgi:photosystem II stability/assembly factor-like uncharacterized protein